MSYEGAALPFDASANYGTWSIDFAFNYYKRNSCRNSKSKRKLIAIAAPP